jgi:hypothetical protein
MPTYGMNQGTQVEVRSRFDQRWTRGFEVGEVIEAGRNDRASYRIRRRSDGYLLPASFSDNEIRAE